FVHPHSARLPPASYDLFLFLSFFTDTASTEIYSLSLHDALPISMMPDEALSRGRLGETIRYRVNVSSKPLPFGVKVLYLSTILADRKSTRLNSSHVKISYAVFCLKKKKIIKITNEISIKKTHHNK